MKRRLLDILACPNDGHFPLDLRVDSTEPGSGAQALCESHCSLFSRAVEEFPVDISDCRQCLGTEIVTGEIHCSKCDSVFEIIDGIPKLLADQTTGDHGVGRDKVSEIAARDSQADEYDELKMLKMLTRLEAPRVLEMLDVGGDDLVIELGAGTGRLTEKVASAAAEVVAADFSIESLKRARDKCSAANVHWVCADVNHLPFKAYAADHAFSCQVFEHLPGTAVRNMAVDETARVMKAGGTFVISVYRDSWVWRLFGPKEGYHPGGIYYYRLSQDEFENMLERKFAIKKMVPNLALYLQLAKCVKSH